MTQSSKFIPAKQKLKSSKLDLVREAFSKNKVGLLLVGQSSCEFGESSQFHSLAHIVSIERLISFRYQEQGSSTEVFDLLIIFLRNRLYKMTIKSYYDLLLIKCWYKEVP